MCELDDTALTATCDNSWKVYVTFYKIFFKKTQTSKITNYCDDGYRAISSVSHCSVMTEISRKYNNNVELNIQCQCLAHSKLIVCNAVYAYTHVLCTIKIKPLVGIKLSQLWSLKIVHLLRVTIVLSPIVAASHVRKKKYFIQMKWIIF